jgi:hypothetical protein
MADHAGGVIGAVLHIAALHKDAIAITDKRSAKLNVGGNGSAGEYGDRQDGEAKGAAAKLHDEYLGWRV